MSRVVYLHGFASSPLSKKARFFARRFAEMGVPFEAPDLAAGDFEHLTITGQLRVVERSCRGEAVTLMGSSLGGYLAALYAARHPEVEKLILMAPAFCFARRWADTFGPDRVAEWRRSGFLPVYHYGEERECLLSYALIEDAEGYEDYPAFLQRALILHGIHDDVVPASLSEIFSASHANVQLQLVDSDHELTSVTDLMWEQTARFISTSPPLRTSSSPGS